jgi:hypothetical protein
MSFKIIIIILYPNHLIKKLIKEILSEYKIKSKLIKFIFKKMKRYNKFILNKNLNHFKFNK